MNEMVERVAVAIATADEQNGAAPWVALPEFAKNAARDRARAAIAAMRTPTEAMCKAAREPPPRTDVETHAIRRGIHLPMQEDLGPIPVYQRMIDAALADHPAAPGEAPRD